MIWIYILGYLFMGFITLVLIMTEVGPPKRDDLSGDDVMMCGAVLVLWPVGIAVLGAYKTVVKASELAEKRRKKDK